jgi:ppGpp synthetase/RelA/SpoT-type nucleotidyltranferase
MAIGRPESIPQYLDWLKKSRGIEISDRNRTHFDAVAAKVKRDLEESPNWRELREAMREWDSEYRIETGYTLLMDDQMELLTKSYDSFLLKTFRKNVLVNPNWPDPPPDGWLIPPHWFSQIGDILRTLVVVKYLDGVEFLAERIRGLFTENSVACKLFYEAREEGYYAAHLYADMDFEIPAMNWDTEQSVISAEIQISTQLQEVIRRLLHAYYEDRRRKLPADEKWQWDYRSDEFVANYLGHILHYVEGMIVEVRERQRGG